MYNIYIYKIFKVWLLPNCLEVALTSSVVFLEFLSFETLAFQFVLYA